MKITDIEPLHGQGSIVGSWIFAKVTTDEGIVGYGEGTRHPGPVMMEAIKWLKPYVIGMSPFDIEQICWAIHAQTKADGFGIFSSARSAIESACWDIMGKAVGKPVYELLGGKVWERARIYTHIGGGSQVTQMGIEEGTKASDDFGAIAERAADLKSRGFTAVKTFQWGRYAQHGTTITYAEWRPNYQMDRHSVLKTVEKVAFIREQLGDDIEIALDVHGLNLMSSVRLAKAMEPFDLLWYEEPLDPFNLAALEQIRANTNIPIAMSEQLYTTYDMAQLIASKTTDVFMTDVQWNGGVSRTKKLAAMAEAQFMPITFHNTNGPLATIIDAHIAVTLPNFINFEFMDPDVPWRDEVITEPLQIEDGHVVLNGKPGWGVDLNEEALARHPYVRGTGSYEMRGKPINRSAI